MKNNKVTIGVGFSKNKDAYKCADEAVKDALKQLKGKKPKLTMIFYAGEYDPHRINDSLKKNLEHSEFIGGSTDAVIYKNKVYAEGVVAAAIYSDYLNFGVASVDNISKNPYKLSVETAKNAVNKLSLDKYLDSYMLFSRMKKGNLSELIRIPSFFSFVLTRGYQVTKMGNEDTIIEGISSAIGNYIPIFGGSLGNDMDKVFKGIPYGIYSFHSGKVLEDGLIVAFATTGLTYSSSLAHGGKPTNKLGYISDVKNGGFVVSKICEKPIVQWYAKELGVSVKKFRSDVLFHTQKYPLGFPDGYGNIVMRAGGVPFENDLAYIAPFQAHTPVFVMDIENKGELLYATKEIKNDIDSHLKQKLKPLATFVVDCSSRRRVLDEKSMNTELTKIQKMAELPLFGFCSFGEIGSKPAQPTRFHHLTVDIFNLYNKLLSE